MQSVLEAILLDERPRVRAEVGRQRVAAPLRQQSLPEKEHDRQRPEERGHSGERELEVAEPAHAGVLGGVEGDHVHRRSGEREQPSGTRGERERHEQLRRRNPEPDCDDDDHRQQRGHRPDEADERAQEPGKQHEQDKQPRAARPRLCDQELARPGRDARRFEARADHEQRCEEDHDRVAEARHRLGCVEDAREIKGKRRPERHEHDRNAIPDEQRHDRNHDRERHRDIAQEILLVVL